MTVTVGSLCTGYGGLDLAVEEVLGAELAWVCDLDPGSAALLAHNYPDVPNYHNLITTDWSQVEPVDVLTAGWPCQPWSTAGDMKGAEDERAIWPAIADTVRVLRPRLVVLENVAAVIPLGELARVSGNLAALGYVGAWRCVRASDVGAPHQRERIFIVAAAPDAAGIRWRERRTQTGAGRPPGARRHRRPPSGWDEFTSAIERWERIIGRPAPVPAVLIPGRKGYQLSPLFVEWQMGLPAGWVTDVPGLTRAQQLKLLGNGVVPQQAAHALRLMLPHVLDTARDAA